MKVKTFRLNPSAVVLWVFATCIGFLIAHTLTGVVTGLAVGLGLTLVAELISKY